VILSVESCPARSLQIQARTGVSAFDELFAGLLSALEEETLQKYLLIALGGALGSIARYGVGSWVAGRMGIRFPYGTLIVNITACMVIGFTMTYLGRHTDIGPAWRFLIPVGFIGAYSTFSTYEWETLIELQEGAFGIAALYAVGSFAAGLGAAWGGSALGDLFK
jgi:fluoride exporter